jgi:hypothetical protein
MSTSVSYQIITHHQPTALNSTDITAVNGAGRIFQRTLLPTNPVVSWNQVADVGSKTPTDSCWQTQVKVASASAHQRFFHLLQTADATVSAMISTSPLAEASQKLDGVMIHGAGEDTAVFFAANDDGSTVTGGLSYSLVGATTSVRHMIFDMPASSGYTATVSAGLLTLTPGGSTITSANGVLEFTTNNLGKVSQP